jgi:hypothetical protein
VTNAPGLPTACETEWAKRANNFDIRYSLGNAERNRED